MNADINKQPKQTAHLGRLSGQDGNLSADDGKPTQKTARKGKTMTENQFATEAEIMKNAILAFAEDREALENFESYLSYHFDVWMKKYACTPCGLCTEFNNFAQMFANENDA
jgi:hypothetical protein